MKASTSSLVVLVAALSLAALAGCGRSQETSIKDYCGGRVACGIDPGLSQAAVEACVSRYENPDGSAHDQCYATHVAACLGDCYDHAGCAIFDANAPCNCELKDYGCPAE